MNTLDERRRLKDEDKRYRRAAARLSGGTVSDLVSVNRTAEKDGAFVEVVIWVSKAEMEAEA